MLLHTNRASPNGGATTLAAGRTIARDVALTVLRRSVRAEIPSDATSRTQSTLHIVLFGEPLVLSAGAIVALGPRPTALLTYLMLHRERPILRRRLASALWPDCDEKSGGANLRRQLHVLVRSLPEAPRATPWLVIDGASVAWNAAADAWCDVAAYERLLDAGRFAEAVELQTADLHDSIEDAWLAPHRERLHDLQLRALRRLIDAHRRKGEYERAIGYAERVLELDPWDEDSMRDLIELRCASGGRAVAVGEYRRFAARLRRELGVEPAAETASALTAIDAR